MQHRYLRGITPVLLLLSCAASWPSGANAGPTAKPAAPPMHALEIEILDAPTGSAKPSKAMLMVGVGGRVKGVVDGGGELRLCEASSREVDGATRLQLRCVSTSTRGTPSELEVSAERSFPRGRRVVVARLVGASGVATEVAVTAR